jgi:hypothetical protein
MIDWPLKEYQKDLHQGSTTPPPAVSHGLFLRAKKKKVESLSRADDEEYVVQEENLGAVGEEVGRSISQLTIVACVMAGGHREPRGGKKMLRLTCFQGRGGPGGHRRKLGRT